jgi:hypothetical protein
LRGLIADENLSRRIGDAAASARSEKALAFANGIAAALGKTPVILYVSLEGGAPPKRFARASYLPRRPLRLVLAKTKEELATGLSRALAEHEEVSHLILNGHGASKISGGDATLRLQLSSDDDLRLTVSALERQPLNLMLPTNSEAFGVFAGLRSKMARGAKAFLIQCDLMKGDAVVAANKGSALLDLLGLDEGQLYANYVAGVSPWNMALLRLARWLGLAVSGFGALASVRDVVAVLVAPPLDLALLVYNAAMLLFMSFGARGFAKLVVNRGYRVARRGDRVTLDKTTLARFLKTFS